MTAPKKPVSRRLTRRSFEEGIQALAQIDPTLGGIVERHGPAPFWTRPPGFPTLVHMILEQQVSLASARSAFDKVSALCGELTPATLLALDDAALLSAGFSRQKRDYCRGLAELVDAGTLDLRAIGRSSIDEARESLMAVRGIGAWTADCYFLFALRRPDIWPGGDLALLRAGQVLYGKRSIRDDPALTRRARRWAPWRAVAARLLWHYYLSGMDKD